MSARRWTGIVFFVSVIALSFGMSPSATGQETPGEGETLVMITVFACPSGTVEPEYGVCDPIGGVAVRVEVNGEEIAGRNARQ
jgi:hypothetical protein